MNITIRLEQPKDFRAVEELTREAFWGCMNHPTCDGEHLIVHKLRSLPSFVPELDFVAEADGQLVGHIIYSMAKIVTPDDREIEVLNFGPISVLPEYKRMGIGSALMRHSIARAGELGYRAIVFYGHPDYYPRFGFSRAGVFGITSADGSSFDALMAMPLYDGALDGIAGRYIEDESYQTDPGEVAEFDKTFPPKDPVTLAPVTLLTEKLSEHAQKIFAQKKIKHLAQLQNYSGVEMLRWDGMDESILIEINRILKELGYTEKLLPTSYILQLTEMGIRIPVVTKIREKAGISVYRVESGNGHYILKVFEKAEDRREISNYKMLASLHIPTLPMLKHTACALLLPDVECSAQYRLGCEEDASDVPVAAAIARWYKELHGRGREYIRQNRPTLFDETDLITQSNLDLVAEKSGTTENKLWNMIRERYREIRHRIDALPRTVTYNDFYWTNLVVAKDKSSALMLDFNLLGKGYAYGDLRNVASSLDAAAADIFLGEYGMDHIKQEEKMADAFLSPLVTLITACRQESFPRWAVPSLEELKSGAVLESLVRWLNGSRE